jgi:CheY-like chemotaxis protein
MRADLIRTADPPSPSRPLSILVAGDNPTDQNATAKILESAGHRATIVDDGETMLDVLDTCESDLVLMHVNMPAMNGIETTKLYRFLSLDRPYVPIVAVMADATEEVKGRCQEAGMDACITATALLRLQPLIQIVSVRSRTWAARNSLMNSLRSSSTSRPIFCARLPKRRAQAMPGRSASSCIVCTAPQPISGRAASTRYVWLGARSRPRILRAGANLERLREEFERVRRALEGRLFERNIVARRT